MHYLMGSFKHAVMTALLLSLAVFSSSAAEVVSESSTACLTVRTVGIDANDNFTIKRTAVVELGRNVRVDFNDNRRYVGKLVEWRLEVWGENPTTRTFGWSLVFSGKREVLRDQDSEIGFVIDPQSSLLPPAKYRLRLSIGQSANGLRETGSCQLLPAVLLSETVRTPPFVVAGQPAGNVSRTYEQWQDAVPPIEFKIASPEEGGQ